jgi:hypothetical protein
LGCLLVAHSTVLLLEGEGAMRARMLEISPKGTVKAYA